MAERADALPATSPSGGVARVVVFVLGVGFGRLVGSGRPGASSGAPLDLGRGSGQLGVLELATLVALRVEEAEMGGHLGRRPRAPRRSGALLGPREPQRHRDLAERGPA